MVRERTSTRTRAPGNGNGASASVGVPDSPSSSPSPGLLSSLAPELAHLSPADRRSVLRSTASAIVERYQLADRMEVGWWGTGLQSIYNALGYKRTLTIADYRDLFKRDGMAQVIVSLPVQEMWAGGVYVYESEDPDVETEFDVQVKSLLETKRLNVVSRLMKADVLAGLGRYAVLLIGVKDKPNARLSDPMPRLSGPDDVIYLTPYAEDNAEVVEKEGDTSSKRFGLPKMYRLKTEQVVGGTSSSKPLDVHWSRVIHIAHGLLESDWCGTPDLEKGWNRLCDLTRVIGGGSKAAWNRMDPGKHIKLDPEYTHEPGALDDLQDQLDEYEHDLRRTIATEGVDIDVLSAAVDKFNTNADTILDQLAGTYRIPQRKLKGNELGLRATENDEEGFASTIAIRYAEIGEPVVRQLVDRGIDYGFLPTPKSREYVVSFAKEQKLTEKDKAETVKTYAAANQAQHAADGTVIYTRDEIRDKVGDDPLEVQPSETVPETTVEGNAEPASGDGESGVPEIERVAA